MLIKAVAAAASGVGEYIDGWLKGLFMKLFLRINGVLTKFFFYLTNLRFLDGRYLVEGFLPIDFPIHSNG